MDETFSKNVPMAEVYPLRDVEGWEKVPLRTHGFYDGSDGKYTCQGKMSPEFYVSVRKDPKQWVEFYGFYQGSYYKRKAQFVEMCMEIGVVNVVENSRAGLFCMIFNLPFNFQTSNYKAQPYVQKRKVYALLNGLSMRSLDVFEGEGNVLYSFQVEDESFELCENKAGGSYPICEQAQRLIYQFIAKSSTVFDYFKQSTYDTHAYASFSYEKHSGMIKDLVSFIPDRHYVSPGDGVGIVASLVKGSTCGDLAVSVWSHPSVKQETFSQTLQRSRSECLGRRRLIVVSYIWNLADHATRRHFYESSVDSDVVVFDSTSPATPVFPSWYNIGPGVWSTSDLPVQFTSMGEKPKIDPVIPFSENLLRFNPGKTYGMAETWVSSISPLDTRGSGEAHSRVSTIMESQLRVRYFVQTGGIWDPQRISVESVMTLQDRTVYYTGKDGTYDSLLRRTAHEEYGQNIYFWFNSKGKYSFQDGSKSLDITVQNIRLPTQRLLIDTMGRPYVQLNDGPSTLLLLNSQALDSIGEAYGHHERASLERQLLERRVVVDVGDDPVRHVEDSAKFQKQLSGEALLSVISYIRRSAYSDLREVSKRLKMEDLLETPLRHALQREALNNGSALVSYLYNMTWIAKGHKFPSYISCWEGLLYALDPDGTYVCKVSI